MLFISVLLSVNDSETDLPILERRQPENHCPMRSVC